MVQIRSYPAFDLGPQAIPCLNSHCCRSLMEQMSQSKHFWLAFKTFISNRGTVWKMNISSLPLS